MPPERRYSEQEIAAIFQQAAADQEAAGRRVPQGGGLTLAEIEQIGNEAGITPAFIARAAAALDRAIPPPPPTTALGIPVSVARTVDLPGAFSDQDWDRLVADLHETFHVPGKVRRDGSLRQWRNEHLQVLVEPTDTGHRLLLRTLNETQRGVLLGGMLVFLMGLLFMLIVAAKGDLGVDPGKTMFVSLFSALGLGGMGVAAFRLPRWRAEQERRLEAIAARALERTGLHAEAALRPPDAAPRLDPGETAGPGETEQPRMKPRTRS